MGRVRLTVQSVFPSVRLRRILCLLFCRPSLSSLRLRGYIKLHFHVLIRLTLPSTCGTADPYFRVQLFVIALKMEDPSLASTPPIGSRHLNLRKSFKVGVRSLLIACPREDFLKAFSGFSIAEQECLYGLFIQVITSLHENIEDDFDSLCVETQAGAALDTVEQLVEEQGLDPLYAEKTNVGNVRHDLSAAEKNEIQSLETLLAEAENQKQLTIAHIEDLMKKRKNCFKCSYCY